VHPNFPRTVAINRLSLHAHFPGMHAKRRPCDGTIFRDGLKMVRTCGRTYSADACKKRQPVHAQFPGTHGNRRPCARNFQGLTQNGTSLCTHNFKGSNKNGFPVHAKTASLCTKNFQVLTEMVRACGRTITKEARKLVSMCTRNFQGRTQNGATLCTNNFQGRTQKSVSIFTHNI
jgi:hypothetical protein